jgi:hypothetical protein
MSPLAPDQALEYYQQTGELPVGYTKSDIEEMMGITPSTNFYIAPNGERIATLSNGDTINVDTGEVYQLSSERPSLSEDQVLSELNTFRKELQLDPIDPFGKKIEPFSDLAKDKGGGGGGGYYCAEDNDSEYCTALRAQRDAEREAVEQEEADRQYEEFLKEQDKKAEEEAYDPYDPNRPEYDRTLVRERELEEERQRELEQGDSEFDEEGYDENGYDVNGYNRDGLNEYGYPDLSHYYDYYNNYYGEYDWARDNPNAYAAYQAYLNYIGMTQEEYRDWSGFAYQSGDEESETPTDEDVGLVNPNVDPNNTSGYYNEEGVFVLPDFPVVEDEEVDTEVGDYTTPEPETPINLLEIEPEVPAPSSETDPGGIREVQDTLSRYDDTRFALNELLRQEDYSNFQDNILRSIGDIATPQQGAEFGLDKSDAIVDQIVNFALEGGLDPLNSVTVLVNTIEGVLGKELVNLPNAGYLINNVMDRLIPQDVQDSIEANQPGFIDSFRAKALEGPTGYLNEGFNLTDTLFRNTNFAKNIRYGLPPSEEQRKQQYYDFFEALGVEPPDEGVYIPEIGYRVPKEEQYQGNAFEGEVFDEDGNVSKEYQKWMANQMDGPGAIGGFLSGVGDTIKDIGTGIGEAVETGAFTYQKALGGTVQKFLANYLLPAVTTQGVSLPASLLLDFASKTLAPSDAQQLSDYLQRKGIDPTTATMGDVAAITFGGGLSDIGPQDTRTGIQGGGTIYATDEQITDYYDQKRFNDAINLTSGGAGATFVEPNGDGQYNYDIDTDTNILGTDENKLPENVAGFDPFAEGADKFVFDPTKLPDDNTEGGFWAFYDSGIDASLPGRFTRTQGTATDTNKGVTPTEGTGPVDSTDTITNGTTGGTTGGTMADNTTLGAGNAYDPAYELARILYGEDVAGQYRGGGLAQTGFQDLIDRYQRDVEGRAFERTAALGRAEQNLVNALRQRQRGADVSLLGQFGEPMAEALRGVDPRIEEQVGEQRKLAQRLYGEAAGDFSPEREAEIMERAFETGQMQGRARDPRLAYDRLLGAEDARASREARAQQAGVNLFNQAQAQTGAAPGLVLGLQGSPYERGVGTVSPVFGATAAINQSLQNYQNQQNLAANQQAQNTLRSLYSQAAATNDLSTMEKVQSAINSLGSGLETIESVGGIIQGLPDTYNDVKNTFTGIVDTVKNIPVVGGVLGGAANVAGGVLGGVAGLAGDTFGGAVDLGADALSGVGSLFGGAANTAISGLGDGLTDVTGFMGQTFDTGANLFGSLTGGLGGGSVNVADNIFDLGSSAASSTIDYGKNLFKSLW